MEKKVTEVVAALIWDGGRFLICQRPAHKARGVAMGVRGRQGGAWGDEGTAA